MSLVSAKKIGFSKSSRNIMWPLSVVGSSLTAWFRLDSSIFGDGFPSSFGSSMGNIRIIEQSDFKIV